MGYNGTVNVDWRPLSLLKGKRYVSWLVSTFETMFRCCVGELGDCERLLQDPDGWWRWRYHLQMCRVVFCWMLGDRRYIACIIMDPECCLGGHPRAMGSGTRFHYCMLERSTCPVGRISVVESTLGVGFVWFWAKVLDAQTLSNAWLTSKKTAEQYCCSSQALLIYRLDYGIAVL